MRQTARTVSLKEIIIRVGDIVQLAESLPTMCYLWVLTLAVYKLVMRFMLIYWH